ncbi:hypothetical protein [Yoonia sp.]|uniref:hypothetical protein n=1 Tax=Yoonia sp. TaxID=2212373 RepID=UPI0019FBB211|nr:hypothetical protein [Yoonia sp.]MBE0413791.1 hypothetical protein [Yoonia sp.]
MKGLTVLLIWLLTTSVGLARPLTIRTGEHADFTRVVLTIPIGVDWRLGRDAAGYVLQVPVPDGYDTSGFFDLIPRDRILDVTQDRTAGLLRMALNCDCSADAFLYRSNFLVIDIRDSAPAPDSPFEGDLSGLATPGAQLEKRFSIPRAPILPILPPRLLEAAFPVGLDATSFSGADADPPEISTLGPADRNADLENLERAVVQSLGRALSQGLLDANFTPNGDEVPSKALKLDAVGAQAPGISAKTSIDENLIPPNNRVLLTQTGDTCLPADYFDVAAWGDDRAFHVQISEIRVRLIGEFDRFDETAVTELARRFVYFGFGREARQVLSLDGIDSQERRYMRAVANIIDGDPIAPDMFLAQVSCPTQAALWAMLAQPEGAMDATVNRNAVLRSFLGLPRQLQRHLGPALALRFMAIGDNYAASQALAATRVDPARTIAADLAEAALAGADGAGGEVVAALAQIADTDVRMTPEAMVGFFTEAVKESVSLKNDDFLLADALRFENSKLPIASDLAVAQIKAFIAMDRFAEAQTLINEVGAELGEERTNQLSDIFANQASLRMGDSEFLAFVFDAETADMLRPAHEAVARRLRDLGFPEEAQAILARQDDAMQSAPPVAAGPAAVSVAVPAGTASLPKGRQIGPLIVAQEPPSAIAGGLSIHELGSNQDVDIERGGLGFREKSKDLLNQSLTSDTPLASGRALLEEAEQARLILEDLLERSPLPQDF